MVESDKEEFKLRRIPVSILELLTLQTVRRPERMRQV
jgi:hypothetical protein